MLVDCGKDIPSSKDSIVGMLSRHVSSSLGSKIVEFNCCHTLLSIRCWEKGIYLVDTRDYFLGDGYRVNMVRIKSITQSTDACSNLNHVNTFPKANSIEPKDTLSNATRSFLPSLYPKSVQSQKQRIPWTQTLQTRILSIDWKRIFVYCFEELFKYERMNVFCRVLVATLLEWLCCLVGGCEVREARIKYQISFLRT